MRQNTIRLPKEQIARFCQKNYIRKLSLFGSILREDFHEESDVDVLVEFDSDHIPGFIRLHQIEQELSTLFGCQRLDVVTEKFLNPHFNRHIFDINCDIEHSILNGTKLFLLDIYIWNRTNPSKKLMFGSYPYPRNFYAQNTIEFITVYVKDGSSENNLPKNIKDKSKLTEKEWVEFTKQIWNIPIPGKSDLAFGEHSALMPEEIVRRCVRLFTYVGDAVLDPFAGSGTTLKVAKELKRNYIGYEISKSYERIINLKLHSLF